VTGETRF